MLEGLEINIKKSKRKTLSIYVERDGKITVLAPIDKADDEIEKIIKSKEYQIYKHHTNWEQLNDAKVHREFVNGQSYLYLGRNYRLELVDVAKKPLMLKNGLFILQKKELLKAKQHFIAFYKEMGIKKISGRIDNFAKRLGVEFSKFRIIELKNRWASCSEKGMINFHWKCFMAPLDVLDYIIVHELVHLKHKNHTKSFWNEIDKILPDYDKHVHWLRDNGAGMDL